MLITLASEGLTTTLRLIWNSSASSEQWTDGQQFWESLDAAADEIDMRHRRAARGPTPMSEPDEWR